MEKILKLSISWILASSTMAAHAGISIIDNEKGNFSIGGNVELNFNYQDRDSNENGKSEFNQDGRVLVEFEGERYTESGYFVGVKAQPLFGSTGDVNLDDAYFEFGKVDGWKIKAGRFEAYDMFPVGLDVFLEYSGDTSNNLYSDGSVYAYQSKEGRGRGSDGQVMYSQSFDNIYVEIGAMLGDRTGLFNDSYHGQVVNKDESEDGITIRPVVAYQMGSYRIAASVETNLISDTVVIDNGVDISERTGYGLTGNWSQGNWSVNANFAYLDAVDETNTSAGINMLYKRIGLGYVYATNTYENQDISNWADGDVDVSTWYASYAFDDVIDVENFSVLLGSYFTSVNNKLDAGTSQDFAEDDDFGARIRLFYSF